MVSWADTIIVIHPIWWWGAPAILKGWVDRVFSHGFAYTYGPKGPEGLLAGKKALVFTSSGSDENQWKADDAARKAMLEEAKGIIGGL